MTTRSHRRPVPSRYRLQVGGHLDHHWSRWFGLTMTHEDDGTTSMTGVVGDQAELHGLLSRIRDLGVPLLSLQRIPAAEPLVAPDAPDAPDDDD